MRSSVKLALALWTLLAVMVFSVTFDWQTRLAGWQFVGEQAARQRLGMPLDTIENGFRPKVRAAARQSSLWLLLILAGGAGAVLVAARRETKDAF